MKSLFLADIGIPKQYFFTTNKLQILLSGSYFRSIILKQQEYLFSPICKKKNLENPNLLKSVLYFRYRNRHLAGPR